MIHYVNLRYVTIINHQQSSTTMLHYDKPSYNSLLFLEVILVVGKLLTIANL